jgi:hypothetical protein
MRAATVLNPLLPATAVQWTGAQLAEWGLPQGMARLWIDSAAPRLVPVAEGEIVLEYDVDLGIVTCELWSGGQIVFGLDDWVG